MPRRFSLSQLEMAFNDYNNTEWNNYGSSGYNNFSNESETIFANRKPLYPRYAAPSARIINLQHVLETYYLPCALFLGITGNLLSFVTFMQEGISKKFYSQFLAAISASDSGFIFGLLFTWIHSLGLNVFIAPGLCEITVFFSHYCLFLSAWYTVVLTAVYLLSPMFHFCKKMQGSVRSTTSVVAIAVLSFAAYWYKTWTYGAISVGNRKECIVFPENAQAMETLNLFDLLFTLIFPFIWILIFDALILISYLHSWYFNQNQSVPAQTSPIHRLLVSLTVVYHCLVSPGCILHLLNMTSTRRGPSETLILLGIAFHYMSISYVAVKFLVYIIVFPMFRSGLKTFVCKALNCKPRGNPIELIEDEHMFWILYIKDNSMIISWSLCLRNNFLVKSVVFVSLINVSWTFVYYIISPIFICLSILTRFQNFVGIFHEWLEIIQSIDYNLEVIYQRLRRIQYQ